VSRDVIRVEPVTWRGLDAWQLTGARLNLVVTRVGAQVAAIRHHGERLNPLWEPPWPAADPADVRPSPESIYGAGIDAPLLAGISGHNVCIDRFGPPWPNENKPVHGEAGAAIWRMLPPFPDRVEFEVRLPMAKLHIRRRFELMGDTCRLSTALRSENDGVQDIEWAEHPTVGDPFLTGAKFTAGIDLVVNWPLVPEPGSRFCAHAPEADIPVSEALAMPAANAAPCGDVLGARVIDGWWTAENRALRRRLTYRWNAEEFPWLAMWTQHRSRTKPPWNGVVRSRGMEFSTKPFPEGKPPAARARSYRGRPTTLSLAPGRWLERAMTIAWERMDIIGPDS
jgi:hypothetical protein